VARLKLHRLNTWPKATFSAACQARGDSTDPLITAARNANSAAIIETIPIRAGQPFTEPQKFTAHSLIEDPALTPEVPFHLDQTETRPRMNRAADVMNSLRARIASYFALSGTAPQLCLIARSRR